MNKTCPSCGTPFNVNPQDEGKQFNCFKCNTALTVTRTGIQAVGAVAAPSQPRPASTPTVTLPAVEELPAQPRRSASLPGWLSNLPDLPTCLFGAGTFFIIWCLFSPVLADATAKQAAAAVELGQMKMDRFEKEHKAKTSPTVADEENRKKLKDAWDKEKERLDSEAKEKELNAKSGGYWYTWGMMFGFLLLAFASLGYLDARQPMIRRIVGAVVLVAVILLVLSKYTGGGGLLKALLG